MYDLTSAISALIDIGYRQSDALTKIDNLIKMYGIDRAMAAVTEMENDFYLKDIRPSIFYGKDNRYHCFMNMPDGKRKHIVAKDKLDIENKIVKLCKRKAALSQTLTCCMDDIVEDYLRYKEKDASKSTAYRARSTYNRYLKDSQIATIDMKDLTPVELKEFCLEQIEKYHLTGKSYRELKSFLNCLFDFALDAGIITVNTARQMTKINYRKFSIDEKKPESQVYSLEEEALLYRTALEMYQKTDNTCYLAIILSGCFGLRIGELVALKEEDIDLSNMELRIERSEITKWKKENGKLRYDGVEVVDRLKTTESKRSLPITESAFRIFELVIDHNRSHGFSEGYLFLRNDGTRVNVHSFARALKRTNKNAGLTQRSNHKLRKTLLSELEHEIGSTKTKAFAGHSHNSVTLEQNYLYITSPLVNESATLEHILSDRVPATQKSEQK